MKNSNSRKLLGVLCFSVGVAILLSMILPNWIWMSLIAFTLIVCGALFLY